MYIVDETEYLTKAYPALSQIFINDNPFNCPFSQKIRERKIIYRYNFEITEPLVNAVMVAASNLGDTGFYLALAGERTGYESISHVYINFSELSSLYIDKNHKDYETIENFFLLENFVYSPQGLWGILLSHESFGLLGGVPEFIKTIERLVPNINRQVYDFINYFSSLKSRHPNIIQIDWLPGLLTHVYGQETAEILLKEAELF